MDVYQTGCPVCKIQFKEGDWVTPVAQVYLAKPIRGRVEVTENNQIAHQRCAFPPLQSSLPIPIHAQ